jgi:phosphoglycerate dehydrogenase-like enzyme
VVVTINTGSSPANRSASKPGDEPARAAAVVVMIASPLDPALVAQVEAAHDRVEVLYEPTLLPPTRYPCDHQGEASFRRDSDGERLWTEMLARAEVLFGIPGDTPEGLAHAVGTASRLRWVQATAAGAGEQLHAAKLSEEQLRRVVVTSTSGVHAGPLAEFCMLGLLAFTKGLPRLLADKEARHWDHYPVSELADRTLLIVGLGAIGTAVARLAKTFGMHTIGVNRRGNSDSRHVDETHPSASLGKLLAVADAVVLSLPLTEETKGLLDAEAIAKMRAGAVVVNVGRGGVIDEEAVVEALRHGRLAGAALDVFATEPLPPDSALWTLPNVLVSPHTTGLSVAENERIITLFTDNLGRYLNGEELVNRVDATRFY